MPLYYLWVSISQVLCALCDYHHVSCAFATYGMLCSVVMFISCDVCHSSQCVGCRLPSLWRSFMWAQAGDLKTPVSLSHHVFDLGIGMLI